MYCYPPRFINGSLYVASSNVEYIRGKILQALSIIQGELIYDQSFGIPLTIFKSFNNFSEDVLFVENFLILNIPQALFSLDYVYVTSGVFILNVLWVYQGQNYLEKFTIDTLSE